MTNAVSSPPLIGLHEPLRITDEWADFFNVNNLAAWHSARIDILSLPSTRISTRYQAPTTTISNRFPTTNPYLTREPSSGNNASQETALTASQVAGRPARPRPRRSSPPVMNLPSNLYG